MASTDELLARVPDVFDEDEEIEIEKPKVSEKRKAPDAEKAIENIIERCVKSSKRYEGVIQPSHYNLSNVHNSIIGENNQNNFLNSPPKVLGFRIPAHIPFWMVDDEVRDECTYFGTLRPGKGAAADILPILWNNDKFKQLLQKRGVEVPIYSLDPTDKQLVLDGPWMRFTFGYKPRAKKTEEGKQAEGSAVSNTLRLEFARDAERDSKYSLDNYKKWLAARDAWYLKKAFEARNGSWGEKFKGVLEKQLRKGEEVDLENHVTAAFKSTTKSDPKTTFADGLNFNLMYQTKSDTLGVPEDKFSCALLIYNFERKIITKGLTFKNAVDYKLPDAKPIIKPGLYGKPVYLESHIAICAKDFGLTSVLKEVRIAEESQLFPEEEELLCAF